MAQSVRQSDFVARFGGEEFVAFLQGSDVAGAEILAEKFRVAIASQDIPTSDGIVKVTVSVGLSETTAAQTVFAAVNDADSALLLAKQRGRTRVVVANSVLEKRATAGAALLAS